MKNILIIAFVLVLTLKPCFAQEDAKLGLAPGNYVAFLVGANDYKEYSPLKYPLEDIRKLQSTLLTYAFKKEHIVSIENPTEKSFFDKANELKKIVKPNDYLLVYVSMHGKVVDGRKYFWLPVDAKIDERHTWIYVEEFLDILDSIDCKHILLIIDTCFAGSIFKIINKKSDEKVVITIDDVNKYKSRRSALAITSGANMETVPDDSHFFKSLNYVLNTNRHQYLPVEQLYSKLNQEISITQNKESFRGIKITPQMSKVTYLKDDDGQFVFYKPTGIPLSKKIENDIIDVRKFKIENAIYRETIELNAGERIIVSAKGLVTVGQILGEVSPNGKTKGLFGLSIEQYNIVAKYPHGSLIYRIGANQPWVFCGDSCEIRATQSGLTTIEFMINDNNTGDNSGSFDITLRKQ